MRAMSSDREDDRRLRALRQRVRRRFEEHCGMSRTGVVTTRTNYSIRYSVDGGIRPSGQISTSWINMGEDRLRYLLRVDLDPEEPLHPLEQLAEAINEDPSH